MMNVRDVLINDANQDLPRGFRNESIRVILFLLAYCVMNAAALADTSAAHWSFMAPHRPPMPEVRNRTWPKNPIDAFILNRLEQEKISPSPEADRATLLRRVSLDLTGIPPTPRELDAFLADTSADAYEK